jgi:CheY-like chemotaxis protein
MPPQGIMVVARSGGALASILLVVDDDRDLLDLMTLILGDAGYETLVAENGRDALAMVARQMPDLILLDMKMPVMDGWEFAREFHAHYDSQVPILVITAAADAGRRAKEIRADGWIGKPFDVDELLASIQRTLDHRRA